MTRRVFLAASSASLVLSAPPASETIIDIHQHTNYSGRSDEELVKHQREMGVSRTVLLPAGSKYGLAADAGGNDSVVKLAREHPMEFVYFANELPDIPETRSVLQKYLKSGAIGIGEQKFPVEADSKSIDSIADIAQEFGVPVLLHFEHGHYNLGFERFHKVVERHPRVKFIGHAQTWWANIDKSPEATDMYPKGKVAAGGITDRLLTDYSNVFGDLSAGSGLNSMLRDEDHARGFLDRHQDKLLFGSDCNDRQANGDKCLGGKIIVAIRRLAPNESAKQKIFSRNASQLLKMG